MCYIRNIENGWNVRTLRTLRILRIRRILQEYGRVFKGPQSLPRQFFPCSDSQNIIRVNLLGNYSTSCYYVIDFTYYLHTQPNNRTYCSTYYKVPLHGRGIVEVYGRCNRGIVEAYSSYDGGIVKACGSYYGIIVDIIVDVIVNG